MFIFFFFQAEDGIRDLTVTGVQTCALPILAPAVGDDLAVLRYLPQASREFAQRNIDGLRHVTGGVFILRPDVQHRDEAVPEALTELLARHWLDGNALVEGTSNDPAHGRDIALGH